MLHAKLVDNQYGGWGLRAERGVKVYPFLQISLFDQLSHFQLDVSITTRSQGEQIYLLLTMRLEIDVKNGKEEVKSYYSAFIGSSGLLETDSL